MIINFWDFQVWTMPWFSTASLVITQNSEAFNKGNANAISTNGGFICDTCQLMY